MNRIPLKERTHKSRGRVACNLCQQVIPAGIRYTQITTLSQGQFGERRECPTCHAAASAARFDDGEWLTATEIDDWASRQVAEMTGHALVAMRYLERAGLPSFTHNRNGATA